MMFKHTKCALTVCVAGTLITAGSAQCQEPALATQPGAQSQPHNLEQIRQELESQTRILAAQQRALEEQEKKLAAQKRELIEALRRMEALQTQLGGETPEAGVTAKVAQSEPSPAQPVGQRPQPAEITPPPVAPIFEQPGVLTQRGKFVLEPSLMYSYSSTYRVSLVGYTIIPALTIGLIDIRGVNDNSWIGAMTARYGITNRLEVEAKVPYVYRTEAAVTRPVATPSQGDSVFNTSGKDVGDAEISARYQLNESTGDNPYYIAGLRIKARNGKDPFSIPLDPLSGLPSELPTGSGFWAIQPSLSVIYPTDPAVFFGGANVSWNIDRDVGGGRGKVHPGNALGMNFGMGLALNEKASFSVGYEHTWVGKPSASGGSLLFPAATSTQLSSLLFGYAYRLSNTTSINTSVAAGLTRDTPDTQIMLRIPVTF